MTASGALTPANLRERLFALLGRKRVPTAREQRDIWLEWLLLGGAAEKTVIGYRGTTNRFLEKWPELALDEINDEHLVGFIEEARPASRQQRRSAFSNWFGWAARTKRVKVNPMQFVPTYKQAPREPIDVFSQDEIDKLCGLPEPDGTLMAVLFGTGVRKSEARQLQVKHFDLENAELHIVKGAKGGSTGVVPIARVLVRRVQSLIETDELGGDDHIWYGHPGGSHKRRHAKPLSDAGMHKWWVSRVEQAGVPYKNLHNTRHTYATLWRRNGLALDDVSDALRHADPRTTRRVYVHTKAIDLRRRMKEADHAWS